MNNNLIKQGNFTLPGEAGYEDLTLELAEKWGADAIRDSDGTVLSDKIILAGFDIYSTLCLVRADNEWAKANMDKLQQNYLMSYPVIAQNDPVKIDLLRGFFREQFKINTNDESCSNHFVQYAALEGLTGDQSGPRRILATLQERRDAAVDILNSIDGVRCYRPYATFYLFPNVTAAMERKGLTDYKEFAEAILQETGVSVCTRMHFGRPQPGEKEKYIRLAYSGIDVDQINEGLGKLKAFLENA